MVQRAVLRRGGRRTNAGRRRQQRVANFLLLLATWMSQQVSQKMATQSSEADLLPDPAAGTLTVRLHHTANAATDQVIEKLCEELNATETVFPRSNLRLVLKLGSM